MTRWFTPTADNFYSKIPKSQIIAATIEAGKPPSADSVKLKKFEFASLAERSMQGKGWLPVPVRIGTEQDEDVGFTLHNSAD